MRSIVVLYLCILCCPLNLHAQQREFPIYNIPDSVAVLYTRESTFSEIPIPRVLGDTFRLLSPQLLAVMPIDGPQEVRLKSLISLFTGVGYENNLCAKELFILGEVQHKSVDNLCTILVIEEGSSLECGPSRIMYGFNLKDGYITSLHEVAADVHLVSRYVSWSAMDFPVYPCFQYYYQTVYEDTVEEPHEETVRLIIGKDGKMRGVRIP